MSLSRLTILILAACLCACGQPPRVLAPFTVSGNFPRDLYGPIDTRNLTWGHADSATLPITFKPPVGYRVRILRLRGDLVAWPRVMEGESPVKPGTYAGILLGFSISAKESSTFCDFCADGFPLYVQGGLSDQAVRVPFDYDLRSDQVYLEGATLYLKIAGYLNTTGYPIHIEGTYTIVGIFDKSLANRFP